MHLQVRPVRAIAEKRTKQKRFSQKGKQSLREFALISFVRKRLITERGKFEMRDRKKMAGAKANAALWGIKSFKEAGKALKT